MLLGPQFIQPDTVIQNVYDPQSLNRFSFEGNNPIKNKDPTGHSLLAIIAIVVTVVAIAATLANIIIKDFNRKYPSQKQIEQNQKTDGSLPKDVATETGKGTGQELVKSGAEKGIQKAAAEKAITKTVSIGLIKGVERTNIAVSSYFTYRDSKESYDILSQYTSKERTEKFSKYVDQSRKSLADAIAMKDFVNLIQLDLYGNTEIHNNQVEVD